MPSSNRKKLSNHVKHRLPTTSHKNAKNGKHHFRRISNKNSRRRLSLRYTHINNKQKGGKKTRKQRKSRGKKRY